LSASRVRLVELRSDGETQPGKRASWRTGEGHVWDGFSNILVIIEKHRRDVLAHQQVRW